MEVHAIHSATTGSFFTRQLEDLLLLLLTGQREEVASDVVFRLVVDRAVTKTLDQIAAPGPGKFRVRGQVLSRRARLCPDESPTRVDGSDSPTRDNLEVGCAFSHHQ